MDIYLKMDISEIAFPPSGNIKMSNVNELGFLMFNQLKKYQRILVTKNRGNLPLRINSMSIDFRGCFIDGIQIQDCD